MIFCTWACMVSESSKFWCFVLTNLGMNKTLMTRRAHRGGTLDNELYTVGGCSSQKGTTA